MTQSGAILTLKAFHQVFMAQLGIQKMHFLQQNLQAISFTSSPRAVTLLLHPDSMQQPGPEGRLCPGVNILPKKI